jgi:primosomal protein N' (replication factor Y)
MNTISATPLFGEAPSVTQQELFHGLDDKTPATTTASLFADVVFDRPLDHAYTYAVPDRFLHEVAVGKRMLAPFGKGDRPTPGFCIRLSETGPERLVKELRQVLDAEVLLTAELLRLTRWMADYYLCSWGQVLNVAVPAGAKKGAGTRTITLLEAIPAAERAGRVTELSPKQAHALDHLQAAGEPLEPRRLAQLARCSSGTISALVEKGLASRVTRRVESMPVLPVTDESQEELLPEPAVSLNPDQLTVWAAIEQALRKGGFHAFLLHGVTGSGKTEIYLRAMEEVVRQGKEVLILVPEISLTPQTIQRFRGRSEGVAVLHSHQTNAERAVHWRRVAKGQVQVIVGARSAVFAPARRLGLIVIDEEHESSFKQEATPRYHARDVAVMRARLENMPIILGSATPSLESWHNAERGQYTLLRLPNRVLDRPLPQVALVDLRHELFGRGPRRAISPGLERAMRDSLREGGQVMLLLNRRGHSTYVHCPSCGHVESCQYCDLALTYHRQHEGMLCHYCGFKGPIPANCPQCGQVEIRYQGLGTEKLQTEIEQRFAGFVVRRMDSDSMRRPGSHGRVLDAFRRGLIHILLGTQMIAKGLDFPNVTLVGVVNADVGLHFPDFRSAERTFQLLSQVAGRTGRGPRGGKVLIQTFNPDQPCIALAAKHDYESFVKQELAHRRAHHYPPYHRLARLIIRSKKQEVAGIFADRLATAFETALKSRQIPDLTATDVRLLGPAEAPVFRLKGYFRYHFQLQSPSAAGLHQLLRAVLPTTRSPSGVEFTLDVDPFNML